MNGSKFFSGGLAVLCSAIVFSALSCAASISRGGDYGTLTVAFGGPRGLETGWPGNTLPAFGAVTVTVSAADMSTVTSTTSSASGSVSVTVPAGNNRLVEVTAVPVAGAAPFMAKSFYGSASADVTEGGQTTVSIKLSLGTSKIVLPSFMGNGGELDFAESLSGPVSEGAIMASMTESTDFELDAYGRVYMAGNGVMQFTAMEEEAIGLTESVTTDLAYDPSLQVLYANYDMENLRRFDVSGESYTQLYIMSPAGYSYGNSLGSAIAAGNGFLYMTVLNQDLDKNGLAKMVVTPGTEDAQSSVVAFVTLASLGISSPFQVKDMTVKDGVLYILVAESSVYTYIYSDDLISRGKLIAVSTTNLAKLWEIGYSGTNLPNNPAKQFYGPVRFVGVAPKKLYIADEGFRWQFTTNIDGNPINVDRVIEVDLDQQTITGVGLEGEATFFTDFSSYYVYSSDAQA